MSTEKIYYTIIILVSALSVLLSPFFYIRRTRNATEVRQQPQRWTPIIIANLIMIAALVFIWWKWF